MPIPRQSYTAAEWEAHRSVIIELYKIQDRTLPQVMYEMDNTYDFHGTIKMYKAKIAAWGLSKYHKRPAALTLLHEKRRHELQGQPCVFVVHGWLVDPREIKRSGKRARSNSGESVDLNDLKELPEGYQCLPLSIPLCDPAELSTVRKLFYYTSIFIEGICEEGTPFIGKQRREYIQLYSARDKEALNGAMHKTFMACANFDNGRHRKGGDLLREAFVSFGDLVETYHYKLLSNVIGTAAVLERMGYQDIAVLLRNHLSAMADTILPPGDPRRSIFAAIKDLNFDASGEIETGVSRFLHKMFEKYFERNKQGMGDLSPILMYPKIAPFEGLLPDPSTIEAMLEQVGALLRHNESPGARAMLGTAFLFSARCCEKLYAQLKNSEAERLCKIVLDQLSIHSDQEDPHAQVARVMTLCILGHVQASQDEYEVAKISLSSALRLWSEYGLHHTAGTWSAMEALRYVLAKLGNHRGELQVRLKQAAYPLLTEPLSDSLQGEALLNRCRYSNPNDGTWKRIVEVF